MRPTAPDPQTLDHLLSVLRGRCLVRTGHSVPLRWTTADPTHRARMVAGPEADWAPVGPETIWGAPQSYFWFAGQITLPEDLAGQRLYLWVDAQFGRVMGRSDPQCLVRVDGDIRQGVDFNHREVLLTSDARPGATHDILIEAGTIEDRRQIGLGLDLMVHDPLAEAVYFDLRTPLDVAAHLAPTDHRRDLILTTVRDALREIDLRPGDPARFHASLERAQAIAAGLYGAPDGAAPHVTVTGHTHIDVAWLWRVQETRQKMARSMATALHLMDAYPDYRFMYNQGYLLDTLSQDYPDLFDRLKAKQAAGQFEIEGALWLEPDANMTSGESLIRHILRGVRYHQQTFGVRPRIVWLPDTFGYSAALPQIMKLAGLEVFVTHKMSWNDTNRMPNEVFFWQGLDGTKVPTYFLTTQPADSTSIGTTYCPDLKATHVMGAWRRYAQKTTQDALILVYGHGDGGGGPTREMLEHIRRMERGIPGCPRVTHGAMGPYFRDLVARMARSPDAYPTWVGELYLEFHRGTFTSVAEVKRNNRRAEALLRELEAMACLAMVRARHPYPVDDLAALWDIALLNQFHDILPGSSIREVYEDSRNEFATFFARADALRQQLGAALGGTVMNPMGDPWVGLVEGTGAADEQTITHPDGTRSRVARVQVPPLGAAPRPRPPGGAVTATAHSLENAHLRARFDEAGRLETLIDKATGRSVLAGPGNRLLAFRDLPPQFDAWDIDAAYQDQMWEIDSLQGAEVVETGPLRAAIRLEWRYETSRIVQIVSLEAEARQVAFDTWIDWQEPHTLLKAAFPLAIRSDSVRAEVQFGHVQRPTHGNTSWDQARFEAPHHRFVAIEEPGFGAALLNDCKYGYDAFGQTLRLTLLRAPTWPWDGADIGDHRFRYALAIYDDPATLPARAEAFNHPLTRVPGTGEGADLSPLVSVPPGIAVEAIKRAEDSDALILRLWERLGQRQKAALSFAPDITGAALCDLLETPSETLSLQDLTLEFGPFEIKTLKLTWRPPA